jgi:nucleoside-diphosphate-sugar epimerase
MDVRGRHEAFNIACGQVHSIRDLAVAVLAASGADKELLVSEVKSGVATRRAAGARVREAFGHHAFVPLPEGLARTVEWYRHALPR